SNIGLSYCLGSSGLAFTGTVANAARIGRIGWDDTAKLPADGLVCQSLCLCRDQYHCRGHSRIVATTSSFSHARRLHLFHLVLRSTRHVPAPLAMDRLALSFQLARRRLSRISRELFRNSARAESLGLGLCPGRLRRLHRT